jgi:hypothetical protein
MKYQHIGQISRYFKKYRNIETARDIDIVIDKSKNIWKYRYRYIEIPNIAKP